MKRLGLFFILMFFIICITKTAATDSLDASFQLRIKERERFCKDRFQYNPGRDFIVVPQHSDSLYLYCMAEFFRSEEAYNTAITYFREVIKNEHNFIDAYLDISDIYAVLGDLDFAILYLYQAISVLQELLRGDITYIHPYVVTYKRYLEAYEAKGLQSIADIERRKLISELDELYKASKESEIKRYIEEIKETQ